MTMRTLADEHGDRYGGGDGERAPGAFGERVHDGHAQSGETDDDDDQNGQQGFNTHTAVRFKYRTVQPGSLWCFGVHSASRSLLLGVIR